MLWDEIETYLANSKEKPFFKELYMKQNQFHMYSIVGIIIVLIIALILVIVGYTQNNDSMKISSLCLFIPAILFAIAKIYTQNYCRGRVLLTPYDEYVNAYQRLRHFAYDPKNRYDNGIDFEIKFNQDYDYYDILDQVVNNGKIVFKPSKPSD